MDKKTVDLLLDVIMCAGALYAGDVLLKLAEDYKRQIRRIDQGSKLIFMAGRGLGTRSVPVPRTEASHSGQKIGGDEPGGFRLVLAICAILIVLPRFGGASAFKGPGSPGVAWVGGVTLGHLGHYPPGVNKKQETG